MPSNAVVFTGLDFAINPTAPNAIVNILFQAHFAKPEIYPPIVPKTS